MSYEFGLHLKQCGIVSQLTPPGTPQRNGVSESRKRTLLDMMRSMMSLTNLPLSFWGYALETTAFMLYRAPFKNPLRRHHMNYGLERNLSCRSLKFGDVMLMSRNFNLKSSNPSRKNVSS